MERRKNGDFHCLFSGGRQKMCLTIYSQGDASTWNAEIRFKMGSNAWRDVKIDFHCLFGGGRQKMCLIIIYSQGPSTDR